MNTRDPLLHAFEFPLEATYFPYGFALRVRTNDARVLAAAREGFGSFAQEWAAEPVRLDVAIVGAADGAFPAAPIVRSQEHLLWFVGDRDHFATCDFAKGVGVAWLTPRVFSDVAKLRFHFLEAAGLCLVAERHLTGIHAACLMRNGHGFLFCGESGDGKSTLAYALAKRGWTYISDDGSFLVRDAVDNVITGNPYRIRFRPSAITLFPELRGLLSFEDPNGKMTIEVRTEELGIAQRAVRGMVRCVVFLNRVESGAAQLCPYAKELAMERLSATNHYGRASTRVESYRSLQRVLTGEVYSLVYSELRDAVDCMERFALGLAL